MWIDYEGLKRSRLTELYLVVCRFGFLVVRSPDRFKWHVCVSIATGKYWPSTFGAEGLRGRLMVSWRTRFISDEPTLVR